VKVIDGGRSAKNIAELLSSYAFNFANEEDLQDAIEQLLTNHGIPFEREVELYEVSIADAWKDRGERIKANAETPGPVLTGVRMEKPHIGRIDFMVGSVGIEVKVGFSWADVVTQLHRYAQSQMITDLILVTTRMLHTMPGRMNGKPVTVVNLAITNSL
jgi:hypothetical protein